MKKDRIAVIDLGTNTFHLLIAENSDEGIHPLYAEKLPVRIGKGGINQGLITEEACQRALSAMKYFRTTASEYHVSAIYATATSAFRNARNGEVLAERIKNETGIKVRIISGDREAELIYFGVKEALELDKKSLVVDIGGGSVECILCNNDTIFWKRSFEIGGQRLMELFQKNDPISLTEIDELTRYLTEKLQPLAQILNQYPAETLIGSSGSFDTLCDIDLRKKGVTESVENRKEYALALDDFYSIYQELISKNRTHRMNIPGMIELRVDMIVVAVVLIRFILEKFKFRHIRVSTYALKEGVMSRIVKGEEI